MENVMKFVVGFVILCAIAPFLPWIIGIGAVVGIVAAVLYAINESQLTDEEKKERRLRDQERRHEMTMARIEQARIQQQLELEAQHAKKMQHQSTVNSAAGFAGKLAFGILMHSLTGGTHRHRHH